MVDLLTALAILVAVAPLLLLLWSILRFSIISQWRTRGAEKRLRRPLSREVERTCGFSPPRELVEMYKKAPFVEMTEFHMVDRSKTPVKAWLIGGFSPLTAVDILERRAASGVSEGIPIADDLGQGVYLVTRDGAVIFRENGSDDPEEVATGAREFAGFEVCEDWVGSSDSRVE
jgi:hypothetical protein